MKRATESNDGPSAKRRKMDMAAQEDRRLDSLARLLQMTSQGCAAACLIDQTIVIADNEIHRGTRTHAKLQLIQTVMEYFSDLANEREEKKQSREEVFKKICVARLKGEEKGYIKLDEKILEKIAKIVLDTYKKVEGQEVWRTKYIREMKNYDLHETHYVATAYEIAGRLARDFLKIEKFISGNSVNKGNGRKNDLVAAFKGKENTIIDIDQAGGVAEKNRGLTQQEKTPGYIILNIDENGVHAEAKIIEYLVLTGAISGLKENVKIYIGISKLCCNGCASFIKAVNEVFCSKIEIIETRGAHGLQPDWKQPMICKDYSTEKVAGYRWSKTKQAIVPVLLGAKLSTDKYDQYTYLKPKQIEKLVKLAPNLKKASTDVGLVSQIVYSSSSLGSQSPSTHDEIEEKFSLGSIKTDKLFAEIQSRYTDQKANLLILDFLKNLQNFKEKGEIEITDPNSANTPFLDKEWYTYELIVEGLKKKGIPVDNLLLPVSDDDGLTILFRQNIKDSNCTYMVPLNVHPIEGNLGSTSHWVGLYITTGENATIASIKYINPIGQAINQQLALKIFDLTTVETDDLTIGKGTQWAFSKESEVPELEGNDYDCGPMLVQLFYELVKHGKILTPSLGEQESVEFGQKCRKEQRGNETSSLTDTQKDEIFQKWYLMNLACSSTIEGSNLQDTQTWYVDLLKLLLQIDLSGVNSGELHTDSFDS